MGSLSWVEVDLISGKVGWKICVEDQRLVEKAGAFISKIIHAAVELQMDEEEKVNPRA